MRAIRVVSVEQGHDPRGLELVAFGGAGPLHACDVADLLGHARGRCAGGRRRPLGARHRGWATAARDAVESVDAAARGAGARGGCAGEAECELRYRGQAHELTVPVAPRRALAERFHARHRERYGFDDPDGEIEVVSVRVSTRAAGAGARARRACRGRRRCAGRRRCRSTARRCGSARAGRPGGGRTARGGSRDDRPRRRSRCWRRRSAASPRRWARRSSARPTRPTSRSGATARRPCSTPAGRMIAQAEHLPVHLGAMPDAVAAVPRARRAAAARCGRSTTRTPAARTCPTSRWWRSWTTSASCARAPTTPTSAGCSRRRMPAGATELLQEGVVIPPLRLTGDVRALLVANMRKPAERLADLRAQEACMAVGADRLRQLAERFGRRTLLRGMDELHDYSERRIRAGDRAHPGRRATRPRTRWRATASMCATSRSGCAVTVARRPRRGPTSRARRRSSRGTSTARSPSPARRSTSACGRSAIPTSRRRAARSSRSRWSRPEGCLVNAQPPGAVVGGNTETSSRIVDVVMSALGRAVPVPAHGQGTMNNVTFGTPGFTYYETLGGGQGGGPAGPGPSAVHVAMSNTLNTPIEALEREYPLRIERYALRPRTGGAGPASRRRRRGARLPGARRLPARAHDRAPPPRPARRRGRRGRLTRREPPERPPPARQVQPRPEGGRRPRDPHPRRRRLGLTQQRGQSPMFAKTGQAPILQPSVHSKHVDGRPARPEAEAAQVGAGLRSRPAVARDREERRPQHLRRGRVRPRADDPRRQLRPRDGDGKPHPHEREGGRLDRASASGQSSTGSSWPGSASPWRRSRRRPELVAAVDPWQLQADPEWAVAIVVAAVDYARRGPHPRPPRRSHADLAPGLLRRRPGADRDRPALAARAHRAHLAPLGPPAPERDPGRLGAAAPRARPDARR